MTAPDLQEMLDIIATIDDDYIATKILANECLFCNSSGKNNGKVLGSLMGKSLNPVCEAHWEKVMISSLELLECG